MPPPCRATSRRRCEDSCTPHTHLIRATNYSNDDVRPESVHNRAPLHNGHVRCVCARVSPARESGGTRRAAAAPPPSCFAAFPLHFLLTFFSNATCMRARRAWHTTHVCARAQRWGTRARRRSALRAARAHGGTHTRRRTHLRVLRAQARARRILHSEPPALRVEHKDCIDHWHIGERLRARARGRDTHSLSPPPRQTIATIITLVPDPFFCKAARRAGPVVCYILYRDGGRQ